MASYIIVGGGWDGLPGNQAPTIINFPSPGIFSQAASDLFGPQAGILALQSAAGYVVDLAGSSASVLATQFVAQTGLQYLYNEQGGETSWGLAASETGLSLTFGLGTSAATGAFWGTAAGGTYALAVYDAAIAAGGFGPYVLGAGIAAPPALIGIALAGAGFFVGKLAYNTIDAYPSEPTWWKQIQYVVTEGAASGKNIA